MIKNLFILFVLMTTLSCGGKTQVQETGEFNAEKSFIKANKLLDDEKYEEARSLFLEIKNRDLSKKYAPPAQLRIADSYIKEEEPELGIAEYRRFLELYPEHRHAPYAQYQIAMVYFNQIESPDRGSGVAAQTISEFEKLKRDYPRNPYRDVIEVRIEKARNIMADYEFLVGEFYMKKGSYRAAIGRFEPLLKNFPAYKKEDRVLFNLGLSYKESGQIDKAEDYFKNILEKYPESPLVSKTQKELSALKKKTE